MSIIIEKFHRLYNDLHSSNAYKNIIEEPCFYDLERVNNLDEDFMTVEEIEEEILQLIKNYEMFDYRSNYVPSPTKDFFALIRDNHDNPFLNDLVGNMDWLSVTLDDVLSVKDIDRVDDEMENAVYEIATAFVDDVAHSIAYRWENNF